MNILIEGWKRYVVFILRTLVKSCLPLIHLILFSCLVLKAQTLENLRTTYNGDKVIITYDLSYPDAAQKFNVMATVGFIGNLLRSAFGYGTWSNDPGISHVIINNDERMKDEPTGLR